MTTLRRSPLLAASSTHHARWKWSSGIIELADQYAKRDLQRRSIVHRPAAVDHELVAVVRDIESDVERPYIFWVESNLPPDELEPPVQTANAHDVARVHALRMYSVRECQRPCRVAGTALTSIDGSDRQPG